MMPPEGLLRIDWRLIHPRASKVDFANVALRLSEKGCERRSKCEFGSYTEG